MKVPMVVDKGRLAASMEVEVGGGGTVYTGCSMYIFYVQMRILLALSTC